jgi:hypothetical protein
VSLHAERHPDVPGAVCVDVHENNPGKQALVQAAGYEATRWWYRMARNLDDPLPDVPPTPPGLTLAPYTADRDEAVRRAHREAFAGAAWAGRCLPPHSSRTGPPATSGQYSPWTPPTPPARSAYTSARDTR